MGFWPPPHTIQSTHSNTVYVCEATFIYINYANYLIKMCLLFIHPQIVSKLDWYIMIIAGASFVVVLCVCLTGSGRLVMRSIVASHIFVRLLVIWCCFMPEIIFLTGSLLLIHSLTASSARFLRVSESLIINVTTFS